jgi:hypothetical protein
MNAGLKSILLGLVAGISGVSIASAASMEALQGAWALAGTDCATVFEKKGGEIRFTNPGGSLDTGIIVSGSKVVGPSATCTATKIREEGDHFSALLNCSDAVLSNTVSMSFRIIDATHFDRFDSSFPDFSLSYAKCPF